ncbi:type I polyketide synthase [Crocosphaera chwakensis]|uniref:Polyketide synthase type I n=1 Tax=Crocosphaera chwakensis CCY0110 TaxID=391612 RepID=A3INX2_9CHRO|nr:type I polyketide synthase [Crocosphaera chwakensis]EAZ91774.1 polyketide synthase type I [Crocosphaera chwakensis CCY0110]
MNFEQNGLEIAVIGISGRFAESNSLDEFWQNLLDGKTLTSVFSDNNNQKIEAGSILKNVEEFDASFFGFNPREAERLDPQHRLFLECSWEAIETAGYDSEREKSPIGVFAGVGLSTYWFNNIYTYPKTLTIKEGLQNIIGIDKDYVPTLASYKLNLTGPSVSVGTACSSSLVAVHLACQSLLAGECDMALAGGVSVKIPQNEKNLCPGEIVSPEGKCRAFDASAQGIVGGNGVGVVTLKRLEDAIADRDCIYAVIKGSAMNNDGAMKVGYTAPSETGQVKVIKAAQMMAEVDPDTITYIEAHGTGTALGDPIEVSAMTEAFRSGTDKKGFCAIGSVKTNVGHLDAAAGITGFIKAVLAVKHGLLPPSLHFDQPNPQIDFENSPFYVNTTLRKWQPKEMPRRAGVSSFGIGGTNVHVILEEAPSLPQNSISRSHQLLLLSAKTPTALDTATNNLGDYLNQHPSVNLADVAYTLQVGRKQFDHRRMMVVETVKDAVSIIESRDGKKILTQESKDNEQSIVFMFTGQGSQYINMGRDLYETETIFRETCDQCFAILKPHVNGDLKQIIYSDTDNIETASQQLQETALTQPALFIIEYALAKLWISWGITPKAMIGHSIGEYVAACLANVFSLEDALMLVANRGKMMQKMPSGTMLSVNLSAEDIEPFLDKNLALAAINSPNLCVVSGDLQAIDNLEKKLTENRINCRRLHTSHAFHSSMMEPIVNPFTELVKTVSLNTPTIPFISNVTGNWINDAEATAPIYWGRQLRQPVKFYPGMSKLLEQGSSIFLEVGPGRTLNSLTRQIDPQQRVFSSLRHPKDQGSDIGFILQTLGQLWLAGININWEKFYQEEERDRLPLPTYAFERQRYWIEALQETKTVDNTEKLEIKDWFYLPSWKRSTLPSIDLSKRNDCWLIFMDEYGLGNALIQRLKSQYQQEVIQVKMGTDYQKINNHQYIINPEVKEHYQPLVEQLLASHKNPIIAHLWTVNSVQCFEESQALGYQSIIYLTQAIGQRNLMASLSIGVVSSQIQQVTGEEILCPEKATVLGPVKVIPLEYLNLTCRNIDLVISDRCLEQPFVDQLITELTLSSSDSFVAYRGNYRWIENYEKITLEKNEKPSRLRSEGVYLITGGTGGIGLALAEYLAKTVQAKLVLLSRSANPNNQESINKLEQLGSEVLVLQADVSNEQQMQEAFNKINHKFGCLNGIIHAAGLLGKGVIQEQNSDLSDPVFAAKVKGTLVLDKMCKNIQLDFLYLWSSVGTILGEFGQVDYDAANIFLDKFVNQKSDYFTAAINWDLWREIGLASNLSWYKNQDNYLENLKQGMATEEGIEAFSRILAEDKSQIIVATRGIETMIEIFKPSKSQSILKQQETETSKNHSAYPRPNLSTSYVAPRNKKEEIISEIWKTILGIEKIGIYDNFFELGGHSLLATQVTSRIQETLNVQITVRELFEHQIIAKLAEFLENSASKSPEKEISKIKAVSRDAYRLNNQQ